MTGEYRYFVNAEQTPGGNVDISADSADGSSRGVTIILAPEQWIELAETVEGLENVRALRRFRSAGAREAHSHATRGAR